MMENEENNRRISISTKMSTIVDGDYENDLRRTEMLFANLQGKDLTFTLFLDGSKDTEFAFNILIHEYLPYKNNLHCIFIYDNEKDKEFTYHNQKDTIISKYETLLFIKFAKKDRYSFYKNKLYSDRFNFEVEQGYSYINKNISNVDYMIFGFGGLKGQTCNYKHQYNQIDYLLSHSNKPFILIKELIFRQFIYHWLFIIDNNDAECLNSIDCFKNLINFQYDIISIVSLIPENGRDYLKDKAISKVKDFGVRVNSIRYHLIEYEKKPGKKIKQFSEFVNFNKNYNFSFIVFYNKPQKYLLNRMESDIFKMIIKYAGNVCIMNNF